MKHSPGREMSENAISHRIGCWCTQKIMKNHYKRTAICLVLSLVIGLFPAGRPSGASSGLRVRLMISGTDVTHKEYALERGRCRQLQIELENAFGEAEIKFASKDKTIASVTKKGRIKARKPGTTKVCVKVTCRSARKKRTSSTWVQLRVLRSGETSATETPETTILPGTSESPSPTPVPSGGGVLPTVLPSGTPGGVTPTISPVPTTAPVTTVSPGTTAVPLITASPGTSQSPNPSGSTGPAITPGPTQYTGTAIIVTVNGVGLPFIPDTGSSVATQFHNELGSAVQTYEMALDSAQNRYYQYLTKQYTETRASTPAQWPAGSLVLMGNNEISVFTRTVANDSNRPSPILAKLDTNSIPAGSTVSAFLGTYFKGNTVTVMFTAS